ncbi:hypothetical protein [Actinomyces glycerinitolerans]|uniref:hypothetical protein n=1 Tax=Actinomyces glycerinitolerans TaxID=1892869 RepID=UPI000ADAF0AD|nr:hypothetical protein [Actinomyces glycerinitolerans]
MVGGITVLAAIGVVAAMVAEVTLEVERTDVDGVDESENGTPPPSSPNPGE